MNDNREDVLDVDKLMKEDAERRQRKVELQKQYENWTFKKYLELVTKDPVVAQNASARFLEIINHCGADEIPERESPFVVGKNFQ